MSDQNSKCGGPFGPSDIPTGGYAITAAAQTFPAAARGIDVLTDGNFEVIFVDGTTFTYAFTAPYRWSGHISGMGAATTGTGVALK